jgi:DUF218 domain
MKVAILLGETNNDQGSLSDVAKARCQVAISLLNGDLDLKVLPTGSFGPFNPSDKAHGQLLTDHLLNNEVSPTRILPYTNSTNTLEDALCARKTIKDWGPMR